MFKYELPSQSNISHHPAVRDVRPNNGFLNQIAALDLQLFRERLARIRMEASSSSSSGSSSESTTASDAETNAGVKSPNDSEDVKQR